MAAGRHAGHRGPPKPHNAPAKGQNLKCTDVNGYCTMVLGGGYAALIVVVAFGLVGGAGFYLVRTQAETRSGILDGFDQRGRLAAGLIGDNLRASDQRTREYANTAFAGPVSGLGAALANSVNASTPWLVVLDSSGRGLGAATLASSARFAKARQHDPLTGLANRSLLHERAENAIAHRRPFAVLFLDLDGFKPVNDTFGHRAGDELLRQVAQRLIAATRPEDYVSRFGGDEFVVLCRGLNDGEHDALTVAERVQLHLSEQYTIDGDTVRIGVSIGIATPTSFEDDAELVIHRADLALYHAKNSGKNRITTFVPRWPMITPDPLTAASAAQSRRVHTSKRWFRS